ncbi:MULTISPECIES: adenosylcobinamide-GDP ribazoletransferase [unclassified Sphingomonas]|jgi:adenosylcobinamide-GDP ribazoletransferase|nr:MULTISPECIES: adenosylcobinamide-GDP ribazoletransferase [unclassified Sphingomonas]
MKGLIVAIQFLTRLPAPRIAVSGAEFAASIRWFPAVGLIVGAIVAAGCRLGAEIEPWTAALAGLVLWVTVTGALHLDGLGDVADAAGAAHKDRERVLTVLADPHLGSFGAVAIGLQLLAKLVLLHALVAANAYPAIALIPFAARIGPLLWTRWLPDLHAGLASRFRDAVRPLDLAIWTIALAAAAWLSPSLLAAPPLLFGWAAWLWRRFGGISGDGHGGGIEVTETGLLLAALLLARLA